MAYTTIDNPELFFNTVLYTGNGGTQSITGVGFQPDWLFIKSRGSTGNGRIHDVVRGVDKQLYTSLTNAEYTYSPNTGVTSFDSDGFSLGSDIGQNTNTETYVAWNWLAGGTASSNSNGSITSSVSVNTTAGFSIVSYTGTGSNATIGHGLGVAPSVIIVKPRNSSSEGFAMYHKGIASDAETDFIRWDETNAAADNANYWNDTAPTSTVFSIGTDSATNGTTNNIAYCFAEVKGYSKFGSYTGNGGNQFIYTGFKPAFVIEKRSSNTSEWDVYDNKRNTFNSVTKVLKPNASDAEATYSGLNFLSNGFEALGSLNDSGQRLIYLAFAETPFVTAGTKAAGTAR